MLLQYHGRFDVVAEFDPGAGRIDVLPRPQDLPVEGTEGWFSILAGVCAVFFRHDGRLWLRVGERTFDLDREPTVEWRRQGETSVLTVVDDNGEAVLRYRAGPPFGPALSDDPTAFVEDEHWDLGLLVSNVLLDEERTELVRHGPA
jgi:hypothetical protein